MPDHCAILKEGSGAQGGNDWAVGAKLCETALNEIQCATDMCLQVDFHPPATEFEMGDIAVLDLINEPISHQKDAAIGATGEGFQMGISRDRTSFS